MTTRQGRRSQGWPSQGGSGRIGPPLSAAEAAVAELFSDNVPGHFGNHRSVSGGRADGRAIGRAGAEARAGAGGLSKAMLGRHQTEPNQGDGRPVSSGDLPTDPVNAGSLGFLSTVNESGATLQEAAGGAAASVTQGSGSTSGHVRGDRPSAAGRADKGPSGAARQDHLAPSRGHQRQVGAGLHGSQSVAEHASQNPPKSRFTAALPVLRTSARVAPAPKTPDSSTAHGETAGKSAAEPAALWRPPPPLVDLGEAEPSAGSAPAASDAKEGFPPLTSKSSNTPALSVGHSRRGRGGASRGATGSRTPASAAMHGRAPSSAMQAAADEAKAASASLAGATRREWLSRLVSQNPLMVAVSGDFRESARLSLRALAELTAEFDSSRLAVMTALSAGVSDAEAAQCLALVAAMEERVGDKLQSLLEFAQTSVVAIGKKWSVPLPAEHMAALGRAMNANIAVLDEGESTTRRGGGVGGGGGDAGGGEIGGGWGSGGTVAGASGAYGRGHRKQDEAHAWVAASASGSSAAGAGRSHARIRNSTHGHSPDHSYAAASQRAGTRSLDTPLQPGSAVALNGPASVASGAAATRPGDGLLCSPASSRFKVVSGGRAEAHGSSPGSEIEQSRSGPSLRHGSARSASRRRRASIEWVSRSGHESGGTFGRSGSVDGSVASREPPAVGMVLDAVAITRQLDGTKASLLGAHAGSTSGGPRSVRLSHVPASSESGVQY